MQLRGKTTAGSLLLTLTLLTTLTHAHNITRLLAKHPEFSTFNHYLTLTHLAADINERTTITVCAVDNYAISALLSKHLSIHSIKNILSLHVFLDYFGAKKLHQITNGTALVATMFQATGNPPGSSGLINITDLKGGKVGFTPKDNDGTIPSHFVKAVKEVPYSISIIQISTLLPNQAAEAPTPAPAELNITGIMSGHGCKVFTDTLLANSDAFKTYDDNVDGGLTLLCLIDDVFKAFLPKFKNLTVAGKAAVLEYPGILVYQSMSMLRSNNGLMNTLATDGASKFDFTVQNDGQQVTLKTKVVTARITGTLIDEQPVAIYTIDKVLQPKELFKGALTLAPAPAPEKQARAPKKLKHAPSPNAEEYADSPAELLDEDPADQTSDDNNAAVGVGRMGFEGLVFIAEQKDRGVGSSASSTKIQ